MLISSGRRLGPRRPRASDDARGDADDVEVTPQLARSRRHDSNWLDGPQASGAIIASLPLEQNEQGRANQITFMPVKWLAERRYTADRSNLINLGAFSLPKRLIQLDINHDRSLGSERG